MLFEYYFWVYSARERYCSSFVAQRGRFLCIISMQRMCSSVGWELNILFFTFSLRRRTCTDTTTSSRILIPAQLKSTGRRLILGACVKTQVNQFSGLFRLRKRHVDFADFTVSAQEDWAMWAGDGRPGCTYKLGINILCLCFAMECCVLLLNLQNYIIKMNLKSILMK